MAIVGLFLGVVFGFLIGSWATSDFYRQNMERCLNSGGTLDLCYQNYIKNKGE